MRYFLSLLVVLTISATAAFAQGTPVLIDPLAPPLPSQQSGDPLAEWRQSMQEKRIKEEVAQAIAKGDQPVALPKQPDPFADMLVADSKITAVTVYNDRAKVTRVAEVDIPAGKAIIAFKDLSPTLLSGSLRVEGSARAAVKFGSVLTKEIMVTRDTVSAAAPLYVQLEKLQDETTAVQGEKDAALERKAFIGKVGEQARLRSDENVAEMNLKPDQWAAAGDVIYANALETRKIVQQKDARLREIAREAEQLRAQLYQLRATGERKSVFAVLVPLESDKEAKLTISLSYQIPNATWVPIYDARVATKGKGSLQLIQYGAVRQQTGEEWKGVALTLSTAQPQRSATLDELNPMWVNVYENTRGFFSSSEERYNRSTIMVDNSQTKVIPGTDSADEDYKKMVKRQNAASEGTSSMPTPVGTGDKNALDLPPAQVASFVAAFIDTGGFSNEYKIPGPADVPTDNTETKLMIGAFDAESKLQVHIKPQLSTEAYLVVRTKLKGESPVLPGRVSLFRDEAYMGESRVGLLRPGEEFDFYFGVDDQVSVKRKTLKDQNKEAGIISKDAILEKQFVTEVKNLHVDPVNVVVKETTPASQNEKVTIEISPDTTQGYTSDTDNIKGLLQWDFTMQPKEGKDLKLGWTVKWPKDHAISGL
ncbi:MAG: mucoidy inhibitor MuiA family protein [Alphaproteobacteria bacterium]